MAVDDLEFVEGKVSFSRESLFVHAAAGDFVALDCYHANGGNLEHKDEDGLALIHYAACYGNVPLIRKLWEHGANMNLLDDGTPPWKPIHYAIFHRKHEAEQVLRTFGAEVPLPILKQCLRNERVPPENDAARARAEIVSTSWHGR